MDELNRLLRAEEGTRSGGSIASRTRDELWGLSQTGNWLTRQLDLDGNGGFTGTGELDEVGTFNIVNELTARDIDNDATNDYTLTYDANGNLTDDGKDFTYEYDVFNRLRRVKDRASTGLVAEYRYNGLGFRIGWHYDVDGDGTVESSTDDPWYYLAYTPGWRHIATFRHTDTDPKERFLPGNAGLGGFGGSSYIDAVVLIDRDLSNGWAGAADGTLERRDYVCQNWRHDVAAIVTDTGKMVEWAKYSAYGVPFGLPCGDTDSDGDWDATDSGNITGSYDVRKDANLDGTIDSADITHANSITGGYHAMGRGVLSAVGNRRGYAGYDLDPSTDKYHVRFRVYDPDLGRWTRRDPLGYVDGMSLYEYVAGRAIVATDPHGLAIPLIIIPIIIGVGGSICAGVILWAVLPDPECSPNGLTQFKLICVDCWIQCWVAPGRITVRGDWIKPQYKWVKGTQCSLGWWRCVKGKWKPFGKPWLQGRCSASCSGGGFSGDGVAGSTCVVQD